MAEISSSMVKELREKTGAGMMDCKKALTETEGDFVKAEEWLRKKGISKAASKGARIAAEGLVAAELLDEGRLGVVVEVNSETDFVAKNQEFVELTRSLVQHIGQSAPADVAALLAQPLAGGGKKVSELITEKIATIQENITVRRFHRFEAKGDAALGLYVHSNSKVAGLVEIVGSPKDEAKELARELAMQVVAIRPPYVDRTQVPSDVLEKEKEIYREELRAAKKPEAIWEKILTGKLEKFYEQSCLVDQLWIKDDKKKVKDLIAESGKRAGASLSVGRMARLEVGEGIEKKKDDLAAEVAKTLAQS
jgi:elongation factor Ts